MRLTTMMEEAMGNWPTWDDGTPVKVGEVAMSLRGPRTIHGIELDGSGYTLWGRYDESVMPGDESAGLVFNPPYIIDQGATEIGSHPVREGEYCDFWVGDERDLREVRESDIRFIAEWIKHASRVYGISVGDVVEMALGYA